MTVLYYVVAKFQSHMHDDTQISPIPSNPLPPSRKNSRWPKCWSLGKDTTSGIHKDRMAREFKGTKETNRNTAPQEDE